MDRFDAMRSFVQIVDSGSFTKAAQQLKLHKTTLSQQLRQLEEKLGARLLTRSTRSVAPTAEGTEYYRDAREILERVDEVETRLRKATHAAAGRLRISLPVAMGRIVFAPEIGSFLERYPRISIELGFTDSAIDLIQEGWDCALRGGVLRDSELTARRLGNLRFMLCAAPCYVAKHGLPSTPEEMARHQHIGFVNASTGQLRHLRLARGGDIVEVDVSSRLVMTDSAGVLIAGLEGAGIFPVADFVASPYLASGALVPVFTEWRCPSLPLQLVTPTSRKRTARVKVFLDWAQALLRRRLHPSFWEP